MQTKRRSTYERIVWEEGLEQGRHAAARDVLLDLVSDRFGQCGDALRARVNAIQDEARLRALARAVLTTATLADFEERVAAAPG